MSKKKIKLSHSSYFQKHFQKAEFAHSFFKEHLPEEIIKRADWTTLRLMSGDFVGKALRNRRSDILYELIIEDRRTMLYIHLEHQRTVQQEMVLRMLYYSVDIWQAYSNQYPDQPLPLIYPLVVYQGKNRWTAPKSPEKSIAKIVLI